MLNVEINRKICIGIKTIYYVQHTHLYTDITGFLSIAWRHCNLLIYLHVFQDCEGGLEIQTPRGERWARVGHLPGAILVNTGELLAHWTNGQLPALRHRVVMPEHFGRGRHSIAFFVHPDDDVPIEPLDTKITIASQETTPCRLQKKKRTVLTAYQHLQRRFRETYAS